ncbi:MAG: nucleoside recognition domain-containing protein [Candidatus Calescibacterium sp.]|nr:ferrous iron transporter B [Candidatus Calescibacterium sp.]MCX7971606.1 ferrous iron transporter B [bacterium]MDW8195814.1 nucleoside recognition domain-containing protein [Candidatus Calescibacterium sp.]
MQKDFEEIIKKVDNYRIKYNNTFRDKIIEDMHNQISDILTDIVDYQETNDLISKLEKYVDLFLTSKIGGIILLISFLSIALWITLTGAGYISSFLSLIFERIEVFLRNILAVLKVHDLLISFLIDGVYKGVAIVVAVMLPPMAIFFPLFTFLEDLGLLPRIALNMDKIFKSVGAHGNQALTMIVGFGCNAAGVVSTRIIKSPKERLIAILTNNFMPCNGRWPLLIMISILFLVPAITNSSNPLLGSIIASLALVSSVIIGLGFTLVVSLGLSKALKSYSSFYILEIPPFRKPNLLRIIYTSIIDRTLFVLSRAVYMAIPAGIFVWIINQLNLSQTLIAFFDPFGKLFGLDGTIILAYIIALPANEIVIPALMMLYTGSKNFMEIEELQSIYQILTVYGNWDWKTGVCVMLFSILHNPCSTTILTIYRETNSLKWTVIATIMPLIIAFSTLFLVHNLVLKNIH